MRVVRRNGYTPRPFNLRESGSAPVKKGRHRRFEEARAQKRQTAELAAEPCAECGAAPEADHASWCLATEDEVDEIDEDVDAP